ncbi:MAG: hypothetical protein ACI9UR_002808 [Bacteroidia bacterium]|jgi:hypothetical protein
MASKSCRLAQMHFRPSKGRIFEMLEASFTINYNGSPKLRFNAVLGFVIDYSMTLIFLVYRVFFVEIMTTYIPVDKSSASRKYNPLLEGLKLFLSFDFPFISKTVTLISSFSESDLI